MRLFKIVQWELQVEEVAWGYEPFKKILKRDKTKDKEMALKEMLFIYSYADIKSDYIIQNEVEREKSIKKDIGLKPTWKIDAVMREAIDFYRERSITPIGELYLASVDAVDGVKKYLKNTDALLNERDDHGKPVTKVGDITRALKDVKVIMQDLKAAHKEVMKEQEDNVGKKKGQKEFGMFEEGGL